MNVALTKAEIRALVKILKWAQTFPANKYNFDMKSIAAAVVKLEVASARRAKGENS